jgi:hypothetical protein
MLNVSEVLRAHMVRGYGDILAESDTTFKAWVTNSKFRISSPITKTSFVLDVYSNTEILKGFAYDINRMASSSFESIVGVNKESKFPKTVGWLTIRVYYAAYFSIHAFLRFFGISCSQFDADQARAVDNVADIYGFKTANTNTASAYYHCRYDYISKKLKCEKLDNTHQGVWKVFYKLLDELAGLVTDSDFLKADRDQVVSLLFNLRERISYHGRYSSGSWLSKVRNDVNYAHTMGAWFPYSGASGAHDEMFRQANAWNLPPNIITAAVIPNNDGVLFVETCSMIVALLRDIVIDLDRVEPRGFLKNGAKKCLNLCG